MRIFPGQWFSICDQRENSWKGNFVNRIIYDGIFFFLLYFWLMYYQSIRWEREGISIIFINFWHFRNIEVIFMVDNFEDNVTDPWYFNLRNFFLPYTGIIWIMRDGIQGIFGSIVHTVIILEDIKCFMKGFTLNFVLILYNRLVIEKKVESFHFIPSFLNTRRFKLAYYYVL